VFYEKAFNYSLNKGFFREYSSYGKKGSYMFYTSNKKALISLTNGFGSLVATGLASDVT